MAKEFKLPKGVKEYTFQSSKGGGTASKYAWDEWFSGKLILIERSEGPENAKGTIEDGTETTKRDYGVPTNAMGPKIATAARARYKVCQVGRTNFDGSKLKDALVLQARDMTPDERVAEDILRAEEKDAAKAKKAAAKATPPATAPAPADASTNGPPAGANGHDAGTHTTQPADAATAS